MARKSILLTLLALSLLPQTSPVPLRAWELGTTGLIPASIPAGMVTIPPVTQADFDGDGTPESLSVAEGNATITSGGVTLWQSPAAWQVAQAEVTDLDHDGSPEATLLVWRPFRPWPVDQWLPHGGRIAGFHNANGDSCHMILIGWREGKYRELWAGSAMAEPVRSFAAADLDGDDVQELVTLEGRYADSRSAPARKLKVWEWNGFGFTVVSSINGKFSKMALSQAGSGRILILVP